MGYSGLRFVVATVFNEPDVTYVPVSNHKNIIYITLSKTPKCASLQLNL